MFVIEILKHQILPLLFFVLVLVTLFMYIGEDINGEYNFLPQLNE